MQVPCKSQLDKSSHIYIPSVMCNIICSERDVDTDVREKRTSAVTGDWSKRSGDTGVSGIRTSTAT